MLRKKYRKWTYIRSSRIKKWIKINLIILSSFLVGHFLQWCLTWIKLDCRTWYNVLTTWSECTLFLFELHFLLILYISLLSHSFLHLRAHLSLHGSHHFLGSCRHLWVVWRITIVHAWSLGRRDASCLVEIIECVLVSTLVAKVIIHFSL